MNIQTEYERVALLERKTHKTMTERPIPYYEMGRLVNQLLEIAKSSLVLRSYNVRYGVTDNKTAYESVGAHTNLMMAIMDRALWIEYGDQIDNLHIGIHTYRSIMEAIRWHDLPENVMGDIPDNGDRDEVAKRQAEKDYFEFIARLSSPSAQALTRSVLTLLTEMEERCTELGRMIYLADKMSALIITLCYDMAGLEAKMSRDDERASKRDLWEMEACERLEDTKFLASEMWAVDYLKARNLWRYDDDGFFTDLLVMATLSVRGSWYEWREHDY